VLRGGSHIQADWGGIRLTWTGAFLEWEMP